MSTEPEPATPPVVKVSETCRCGAELAVEGISWTAARRYVDRWRAEHRHDGLTRQAPGFTPTAAPLVAAQNGALR